MYIVIYFNMCIILKILMRDRRPRWKEIVYFVLTGGAVIGIFSIGILMFFWWGHVIDFVVFLFLFLFAWKGKKYPRKKAAILAVSAMLINTLIDITIAAVFSIFVPAESDNAGVLALLIYVPLLICFSIIAANLFVRLSNNLRKTINQSNQMQNALLGLLLLLTAAIKAAVFIMTSLGSTNLLFAVNAIFFMFFLAIVSISFTLFVRSLEIRLKAQFELQQKEAEQESLQRYTSELEYWQTTIRKFRHDYQNILISINEFLEEKDWDGLVQYYNSEIMPASDSITRNDFALENLNKIKVLEIKGILATKLMYAQSIDNISVFFEANEEIDRISTDSIALVRMLGIILDNAIEALQTLGSGALIAACLKDGADITFIVQNTCHPDIPKLHQLKQPGFSTKGESRGLGLVNLSEIANAYANITLETGIEENVFTQKLVIGGSGL